MVGIAKSRTKLLLITSALLMGFVVIAWWVHTGATSAIDQRILLALHSHSNSSLDWFARNVTTFGDPWFVGCFAIVITVGLARNKQFDRAQIVGIVAAGTLLLNALLKNWFDRSRPTLWQGAVQESGFSYPSGHAMASVALACIAIYLAQPGKHRKYVAGAAVVYVIIIGWSRLYLGVHYPSDILGGWLAASAIALATLITVRSKTDNRSPTPAK